MSSSNYTRVENTAVSGSALLASLTNEDLNALSFSEMMSSGNDIVVPSGSVAYLTPDYLVSGVNGSLRVDGYAVNAGSAGSVNLGSDLNSVAAGYLSLLNLTSVGHSRTIVTQLANIPLGADIAASITLQSGDGAAEAATAIQVNGANKTATLFDATSGSEGSDGVGAVREIVASAINVTSGSEQVRFEIFIPTRV